jgi:hypothetical protein
MMLSTEALSADQENRETQYPRKTNQDLADFRILHVSSQCRHLIFLAVVVRVEISSDQQS